MSVPGIDTTEGTTDFDEQEDQERLPARDALLRAAAVLFAERGAEAVSTREIAAKAGVNNGLIHRHFGTKDALLSAVLDSLSEELASSTKKEDRASILIGFFHALRDNETYWRLIARSALDGQPIERVQKTFATMERAIDIISSLQAQGKAAAGHDPRAVAALLAAIAFGWLVFEPWLIAAGGFAEEEQDQAGRDVIRLVREFLSRTAS